MEFDFKKDTLGLNNKIINSNVLHPKTKQKVQIFSSKGTYFYELNGIKHVFDQHEDFENCDCLMGELAKIEHPGSFGEIATDMECAKELCFYESLIDIKSPETTEINSDLSTQKNEEYFDDYELNKLEDEMTFVDFVEDEQSNYYFYAYDKYYEAAAKKEPVIKVKKRSVSAQSSYIDCLNGTKNEILSRYQIDSAE